MGNLYKKEFVSGVMYISLAKYAGLAISMVISFVMARLLEPQDFGIIGIATVIITFINLLTDFGLGPAIIQSDKIDSRDINSIFSFTLVTGIVASGLFFLSANMIGDYYNNQQLVKIIRILPLNILFASLNIVPNSLLLKEKKFKIIAYRTVLINLVTGVFAIIAAYYGYGVYALVLQSVLSAFGIFIINYNYSKRTCKS